MKRLLSVIIMSLASIGVINASTYSVKVGESLDIYCTASAPSGGWITHAFFSLADSSDSQYLAVYSHSSDCYATVTGISPKSSIMIEVTYAYTVTINGVTHVGSATYYDYVTVKGGGAPTAIAISPSDPTIEAGTSIILTAVPTPANATTGYTWGKLDAFGQPYYFEIAAIGENKCKVYAKKPGKLYLVLQTSNGLVATCIITAVESLPGGGGDDNTEEAPLPDSISLPPSVTIPLGYSGTLTALLKPEGAQASIVWESSDKSVISVSSTGVITTHQEGTAEVTAVTENKLKATTQVTVTSQSDLLDYRGASDRVEKARKMVKNALKYK